MVDSHRGPPGFCHSGENRAGDGTSFGHEEYQPQPLSSQQREELHRCNEEALHTLIIGETAEARALEDVRLAMLAERTRLENLQHSLDERARRLITGSRRRSRQLFPLKTQVFRTPIQNLAAAACIAESIQPSRSEAGRGLEPIKTLLRAAGDQNSVVSQSWNRIHNRSVRADTVHSAHSPRSPLRHGGCDHRQDRHLGRAHGE